MTVLKSNFENPAEGGNHAPPQFRKQHSSQKSSTITKLCTLNILNIHLPKIYCASFISVRWITLFMFSLICYNTNHLLNNNTNFEKI